MYTRDRLISDLDAMGLNSRGTLLAHFSYKSIGKNNGGVEGGPETVIDALSAFLNDGLLVIPTHTWDNVKSTDSLEPDEVNTMDVEHTPVCIGAIPEIWRKRAGVIRSLHPTHSVGAYGADAADYVSGEEQMKTPCSRQSAYGKLVDRDAIILLIGINFTCNTFIHGIEEWNNIPGCIKPEPCQLYVRDLQKNIHSTPQYRHMGVGSTYYNRAEADMLSHNAMRMGKLGDADVMICSAAKLDKHISDILKKKPDFFA